MAALIKTPFAKETLTISTTALPLTEAVYKTGQLLGAIGAFITVTGEAIRFWNEGSTPVATSSGHLVEKGERIELDTAADVQKFKAVRDTSTDATLDVTYYRSA